MQTGDLLLSKPNRAVSPVVKTAWFGRVNRGPLLIKSRSGLFSSLMPEPITMALVSVTVVSVAVCAYKAVDRIMSAPREAVRAGGESVEGVVRTFGAEFRKLFGAEPRISLNRRVIQTGGTAIKELALYKETILIKEEWVSKSWMSTKRVHVQQPFVLKAGFDLSRLKFDIDPIHRTVRVSVAESTILNVEYSGDYEILKEEHGFWNRISNPERDAIVNSLPLKAQEEALKLQLRDKAIEQLTLFLRPLLPPGFGMAVESTDDTICFKESGVFESIPKATLSELGLVESTNHLST